MMFDCTIYRLVESSYNCENQAVNRVSKSGQSYRFR